MPLDDVKAVRISTPVRATGRDYTFEGWIVAVFNKRPTLGVKGPLRYVVQDSRGLLLIHSPRTLELR